MTSLAEMVARNSKVMTEKVITNTYGDTVNQLAPDSNVLNDYAAYLKKNKEIENEHIKTENQTGSHD